MKIRTRRKRTKNKSVSLNYLTHLYRSKKMRSVIRTFKMGDGHNLSTTVLYKH